MHTLFDDVAHHDPSRVATRLLLRASGLRCQGAPSDESFVRELAEALVQDQGKRPQTIQGRATSFALEQAAAAGGVGDFAPGVGRRAGPLREAPQTWKAFHEPRRLPEDAETAVLGAVVQKGGRMVRRALPLFREDARTLSHSRAGSVIRQRLADFFAGAQGQAWRDARAVLWNGGRAEVGDSSASGED